MLSFGPFRFDVPNACVWRGTAALRLSPKANAVLRMLVEQAGQLVSKETFLEAVWPDVTVSDAALPVCIGELRRLLGDSARAPQFIETIHRYGYRFIAPVTRIDDQIAVSVAPHLPHPASPLLVGRETELRRLYDCLVKAQRGERQMVFVTGEPGIGKTALLDAFVAQVSATMPLWTARGQCIAHYGAGEAYLPVLDALGQLCREANGEQVLGLIERYAPTWLVHMPSFLSATGIDTLQRNVPGATPERMLREITDALEALTAERPLVLILEDLHWSDVATIDLLAWLARRRQAARLLLVGTYRPVDVIVRQHPLRAIAQELALHQLCAELPLELLNQAEVGQYLTDRFGDRVSPEPLSSLFYQHTEGNPLFLVTLVEALEHQGITWDTLSDVEEALRDVPQSLRGMVEQQLAQCSAKERQVLEAASTAGFAFAAAASAAGVEETVETIEQCCATLASRGQFLQESGLEEWPDGTVTACYSFRHALYQQTIYEQIAPGRRRRLHQQIGQQLEASFGDRVGERAAELAVHFEHGRDYRRTVQYLQQAAENAARRSASQEVIVLVTKGVKWLGMLPGSPERLKQELDLQVVLGPALIATRGYASPDVERAYSRARELCEQIGDTSQRFPVLQGLMTYYLVRGQLQTASGLGKQLLRLAQSEPDPALLMLAHHQLGQVLALRGDAALAQAHHTQALAIYNPREHRALTVRYVVDLGVSSHSWLAWELWYLGSPDQALQHSQAACTLAQEVSHPYSLAFALVYAAIVHQFRREARATHEQAAAVTALATEQGFASWIARGMALHGWALAMQGQGEQGIAKMGQGHTAVLATGSKVMQPYYLGLLAEAYGKDKHPEAGLNVLAEAVAVMDDTEARFYEAELSRLKGTLLLKQTVPDASRAEACFHQALDIARQQQARSWELRAATSLARLWQQQNKHVEARDLLAPVYEWFTEGFDTADLKDAKTLLNELS